MRSFMGILLDIAMYQCTYGAEQLQRRGISRLRVSMALKKGVNAFGRDSAKRTSGW